MIPLPKALKSALLFPTVPNIHFQNSKEKRIHKVTSENQLNSKQIGHSLHQKKASFDSNGIKLLGKPSTTYIASPLNIKKNFLAKWSNTECTKFRDNAFLSSSKLYQHIFQHMPSPFHISELNIVSRPKFSKTNHEDSPTFSSAVKIRQKCKYIREHEDELVLQCIKKNESLKHLKKGIIFSGVKNYMAQKKEAVNSSQAGSRRNLLVEAEDRISVVAMSTKLSELNPNQSRHLTRNSSINCRSKTNDSTAIRRVIYENIGFRKLHNTDKKIEGFHKRMINNNNL